MPDYLVCSSDTAVTKSDYRIVAADSPSAALEVFNRRIVAYDRVFQNSVLDLAMNMSFVERFYLRRHKKITTSTRRHPPQSTM
jgi:hypothetical protein